MPSERPTARAAPCLTAPDLAPRPAERRGAGESLPSLARPVTVGPVQVLKTENGVE